MVYSLVLFANTSCKKEATPQRIPNKAPIVNAGADITIEIPDHSVSLEATASDENGIAARNWKKISGPASGLFEVNPGGLSASVVWMEEGTYEFEFTATDWEGSASRDTVKVIISSRVNKYVIKGLKPNSSALTVLDLPETVFKNLKWVFCKYNPYCERADAGPAAGVDYTWGGWYYNILSSNRISLYGGYANQDFDVIIYY